jgi:predicted metal-dependent hydrolase
VSVSPPDPRQDGARRLFAPDEAWARTTVEARLLALAARPLRSQTAREAREEENRRTMAHLRSIAEDLARHFGLRYAAIERERDGETRHFGICYENGVIRIRLRHATSDRLLKESALVDTVCHELAHLRHLDHSLRFRRLYLRILGEARRRGHYRPGPTAVAAPRQLGLFDDWGCGLVVPARRRESS